MAGDRVVGADDIDVQLAHRARELGQGCHILQLLLDGGLAIDPVDRVLVDVEGDGTTVLLKVGLRSAQQAQRVLERDKLPIEDPAPRIVDVNEQHAPGSAFFESGMVGAIELHLLVHASDG